MSVMQLLSPCITSEGIPLAIAASISSGVYQQDFKPSALLTLMTVNDRRRMVLYIGVPQLAYILAGDANIFGAQKNWSPNVFKFMTGEMKAFLNDYRDYPNLVESLLLPFLSALTRFSIWHPISTDPTDTIGAGKYTYVVELVSKQENPSAIFNLLIDFAKPFKVNHEQSYATFVTHACRYITDKAYLSHKLPWLDTAIEALKDIPKPTAAVYDRFGHVYKTRLRIIEKGHMGADIETLFQIFWDAHKSFESARRLSGNAYPHPMIGEVQTLDSLLDILCRIYFCYAKNPQKELYTQYVTFVLGGVAAAEGQRNDVIKRLNTMKAFQIWWELLLSAKNTLQYQKVTKTTDISPFTNGTKYTTEQLVNSLTMKLNAYINPNPNPNPNHKSNLDQLPWNRTPILLDNLDTVVTVLLNNSLRTSRSLAYGFLVCSRNLLDLTTLDSNTVQIFVSIISHLAAEETAEREMNDLLERIRNDHKNDVVCWTMDGNAFKAQKEMYPELKQRPKLSEILFKWKDITDLEVSADYLPPRISLVLLFLSMWLDTKAEDTLQELHTALKELKAVSNHFRNTFKTRQFLMQACTIRSMPLSRFMSFDNLCRRYDSKTFDELTDKLHTDMPRSLLRLCEGTVQVGPNHNSAVINWDGVHVHMDLKFQRNKNIETNSKVGFFLGLSDTGLTAHGVRII